MNRAAVQALGSGVRGPIGARIATVSASAGTFGNSLILPGETAIAVRRFSFTKGMAEASLNTNVNRSPSRSVTAGPMPLYGT